MIEDVVSEMIQKAEHIEREKQGRALTPDEADVLRAVGFLRQIAPYLFKQDAAAGGKED